MATTPPTDMSTPKLRGKRRSLVILNTGDGEGKTTAALGLLMRAQGRGLRTMLYQFIKHADAVFGEHLSLGVLGISYQDLGDGFSWRSEE